MSRFLEDKTEFEGSIIDNSYLKSDKVEKSFCLVSNKRVLFDPTAIELFERFVTKSGVFEDVLLKAIGYRVSPRKPCFNL